MKQSFKSPGREENLFAAMENIPLVLYPSTCDANEAVYCSKDDYGNLVFRCVDA